MEAPFPGNSRSCLYRIILWPVVTGKYPVPEYYFPVQLFREIMWKMAIYRPYFDTSGSRKSQIFKFSLIISLLAGNRAQRQVHSRLHPPPFFKLNHWFTWEKMDTAVSWIENLAEIWRKNMNWEGTFRSYSNKVEAGPYYRFYRLNHFPA